MSIKYYVLGIKYQVNKGIWEDKDGLTNPKGFDEILGVISSGVMGKVVYDAS